jgi:hypothetical protein
MESEKQESSRPQSRGKLFAFEEPSETQREKNVFSPMIESNNPSGNGEEQAAQIYNELRSKGKLKGLRKKKRSPSPK